MHDPIRKLTNSIVRSNTCRGIYGLAALILAWNICLTSAADDKHFPGAKAADIPELIEHLDSRDYELRERASSLLVDIGEPAIGPLALHSLTCSSESKWRIKKTLEAICTNGDESVFYKCSGILQVRFGTGGNEATTRKLAELKTKWKTEVRRKNIEQLKSLGAIVTSTGAAANQIARQNLIMFDTIGMNDPRAALEPVKKAAVAKRRLSKSAMSERIEKILSSDTEENRKLVFGEEEDDELENQQSVTAQAQIVHNGFVIRQAGGWQPIVSTETTRVTLPEAWKGDKSDFELISTLAPISELSLEKQELGNEEIESIAALKGLTRLRIKECRLPRNGDFSWPHGLKAIEFQNQNLTKAFLSQLVHCKGLSQLTLSKCRLESGALKSLEKIDKLSVLEFRSMDIDEAMFDTLAAMKSLQYLNLSGAKFAREDHDLFKKNQPNVHVEFQARAFLGVRGPGPGLDDMGCQISAVIPGSGAEAAGIQIGDVIKKVNDQQLDSFDDLRLVIAMHAPGDELEMEILRDQKTVKVEVELKDISSAPPN